MQIDPTLVDKAAIESALRAELSLRRRALPPDSVAIALTSREEEVAEWICDRLVGNFAPTSEEIVAVNKGRHGVRPIAVWDLSSRVLYRMLAERVQPALPALRRSRDDWLAFQRAPLRKDGRYIVTSDIAACYQYIDHGLLRDELLVQTGEFDTVSTLVALLCEVSGKDYGLPQQSFASDVIAEPFLARLERALTRRGLEVDRYNDDFRFSCSGWSEVVRAIEVLEEESRRVGLTVNDLKTITWSRAKYEAQLDEADSLRDEISGEAELDLETEYDSEIDAEDGDDRDSGEEFPDSVNRLAAERVLERWARIAGRRGEVSSRRRIEHRVTVELIPSALAALGELSGTSKEILNYCIRLLKFERTVTPSVGTYLTRVHDDGKVLESFDYLLRSKTYLNGWQTWWLQQPVARLSGFASGAGARGRVKWARDSYASGEYASILRAETARTLARHRMIELDELLKLYERSSNIVRPVLAGAIALLKPSGNIRRAIVDDDKLNMWAYEWAARWS
ncbi:RNA-directed DNA polymerase [Amycolatopsis sp. NEAU-NG30]|uniref:RNA-directed DNA polymerase n=1 Tax=Amycolatopsis melonis TaxID=3156488 RepID=A0ABV0LEX7_9PSEU